MARNVAPTTDGGRTGSLSHRLGAATRVLAVEDDPSVAEFLRAYFRACGYDVVSLDPRSAIDIVDAVERRAPDVVLLDEMLRGCAGHEAYRLLRADPQWDSLPIIMVTANPAAADHIRDFSGQLDGFVTKPFNADTLAALVDGRVAAARERATTLHDASLGVLDGAAALDQLDRILIEATRDARPVTFAIIGEGGRRTASTERDPGAEAFVARTLVARATRLLPDHAVLGRLDSGEVVLVLAETDAGAACRLLEDVLRACALPVRLPGGTEVTIVLRAGVAAYPDHARTTDELVMAADVALVDAHDSGARLRTAF